MTWVVPLALVGIAVAVMAVFTMLGAKKHKHGVGTAGRTANDYHINLADKSGSRYVGDIAVEFDRKIVEWMREGHGAQLTKFSSRELIENGEGELRQWIVMLGALGEARPEFLVYEPLYRSIMGMGVGYWDLEN